MICRSGAASEGGEAVGEAGAGIDGGGTFGCHFPLGGVDFREEGVCVGTAGVDEGQFKSVGASDGLAVYLGSPDDESAVGLLAEGDGLVD